MGNGIRFSKKPKFKTTLTLENDEFDENIDLRNSIKHKTKKFSQIIIPEVISLKTIITPLHLFFFLPPHHHPSELLFLFFRSQDEKQI